jgi:hypothetical protein
VDELDLIRSFRANTVPPTALATARAERAWRRPKPGRPPRPRWGARVAIAACLAVAATVAVLVIPGERESRLGAPEATAAETLRLAAKSQKGGLTRPLQPGEFFYTRAKTTWNGQPADRESWVAIDGTRRWLDERQPGADFRVGPREKPFRLGDEAMTYAELLALPRDAEALHARLRQAAVDCRCGHSVDNETFVIVGDLLRENPIPAELAAALLRSAALIPGIKLIESARDVAGRPGVGVAVDYRGFRNTLIFNRDSYELLGENERNDGKLTGGSAILDSRVLDSLDRPPGTRR